MRSIVLLLLAAASLSLNAGAAERVWQPLPLRAPAPAANPTTPEKAELGRLLFHDKRLSENGTIACAGCHILKDGGADHEASSVGVHGEHDGRNALTVWNVGFLTSAFWDGRAASLEAQALAQLLNPLDMGMRDVAYVTARLRSIPGYRSYFEHAFGHGEVVTAENAARAIAAFERTLVTADSPYDRYVRGDKKSLSEQQVHGMALFRSVGCDRCHQGPAFDGPALREGIAFTMKFPTNPRSPYVASYELTRDQGRFEWTGKESDRLQWRVPSLRNLKYTAPYMHNGSVPTLAHAVRVMGSTELSRTFTDAEVADLVAFLEALSGPLPEVAATTLP
ncbi:MAG: cytochrome-c peroxidase [Proteobacteria bacterium]|nr:cytochrome-c peroxidase [Pseudomonadota bacterium]